MTSGTADVIAPRALMLPTRVNHEISGATGELCISGTFLMFMDGAGTWHGLGANISGALAITP